jgi:hypothetical protein
VTEELLELLFERPQARGMLQAFEQVQISGDYASFFARVHRINCRSRVTASVSVHISRSTQALPADDGQ